MDSLDGIGSLVSMTNGPVYPQSEHLYIAPVYPPIQRIIFSEWHFGQNRFVILSMLISYLSDGQERVIMLSHGDIDNRCAFQKAQSWSVPLLDELV